MLNQKHQDMDIKVYLIQNLQGYRIISDLSAVVELPDDPNTTISTVTRKTSPTGHTTANCRDNRLHFLYSVCVGGN